MPVPLAGSYDIFYLVKIISYENWKSVSKYESYNFSKTFITRVLPSHVILSISILISPFFS